MAAGVFITTCLQHPPPETESQRSDQQHRCYVRFWHGYNTLLKNKVLADLRYTTINQSATPVIHIDRQSVDNSRSGNLNPPAGITACLKDFQNVNTSRNQWHCA